MMRRMSASHAFATIAALNPAAAAIAQVPDPTRMPKASANAALRPRAIPVDASASVAGPGLPPPISHAM